MADVKITNLTANNVDALRQLFDTEITEGTIVLTATTATFQGAGGDLLSTAAYWARIVRATAKHIPESGHPKASLYAVARKLEALGN